MILNPRGVVPVLYMILGAGIILLLIGAAFYIFKNINKPKIKPAKPPTGSSLTLPTTSSLPLPSSTPTTTILLDGHYGIDGSIFPNYSTATKKYLYDAISRSGLKIVDGAFYLTQLEPQEGKFKFTGSDEAVLMAKDRGLEIVGSLGYSAAWIADPSINEFEQNKFSARIDPQKIDKYLEYVKTVVDRYDGDPMPEVKYWDTWNEPDLGENYPLNESVDYTGEFALIQRRSYEVIKQVNPDAQVLVGGPGGSSKKVFIDSGWMGKVLNYTFEDGKKGKDFFDIANAHIRARASKIEEETKLVRNFYNSIGRSDAPLWSTEHGFPSAVEAQQKRDPAFAYGEQGQADYYKQALPKMIAGGVDLIFINLADTPADNQKCLDQPPSPFCSEGLVTLTSKTVSSGKEKPALIVIQSLK